MDGLIHISELSWSHVNHPSEVLEIGQTVEVKVLDIDRERQRISLGLKQTQSDPWQQVLSSYHENDVVEGRVTKVVTFGAFVEILPGVEGLVHISELAQHHVENPREVVAQGQPVNVKIIEVDGDRRRLSLSLKRVEDTDPVQPRADGAESVHTRPNLDLSEDVFADEPVGRAAAPDEAAVEPEPEPEPSRPRQRSRSTSPTRRSRSLLHRAGAGGARLRGVSRPVAVAITGGIGAGKSEALRAFARNGAATVSSDEIVHHLLRRDEVKQVIVARMGNGVLDTDGEIDRGALGTIVFNDRDALDVARGATAPARLGRVPASGGTISRRCRTRRASRSPRCRCSTRPVATAGSTRSS